MRARRSEALLGRFEHTRMRLGLDRMRRFLDALGSPQGAAPVILVAGTNGKGSTAAMLAAMCRAAGYRTGLYTSPHLESVTERLTIDGLSISDRRLAAYLEHESDLATSLGYDPPTFFEALTLAAFLFFRDAGVDVAIMEVGLGGRLDATNASQPIVSLITSISLDHEAQLGSTPASVAREKSGILRRGKPAVAWAGAPEIERLLRRQAEAAGAELIFADAFAAEAGTAAGARSRQVRLQTPHHAYALELALPGRHQERNLTVAVMAAEILARRGFTALDAAAITAGAASCRWPGRLEWIDLGDGRQVLLDAAHNAAGIEAVASYLETLAARPDLLFGALAEKTIDTVLPRLGRLVDRITVARPPGERAAEPERWLPLFAKPAAVAEADLRRALDSALAACEGTLLICGSLYLVGAARGMLRDRFGVPGDLQGSPS